MDYENVLGESRFPNYDQLKDGLLRLIDEGRITREDASRILPELRESEDERVRKEIIEHIKDQINSFIAPPDCRDKYDEEELARYKSWIAYLEKQKEQKPVEWSEEDNEMVHAIVANLCHLRKLYFSNDDMRTDLNQMIEWVQGKMRLFRPKPKQEWSKEDESMLWNIISIVGQCKSVQADSMLDWLKSLRPPFKPSEEQMTMLRAVLNDPNNAGAESCQLALSSLYEQLKKLM